MACERPKPFHVHETHSHFGNPFLQKSFRLLGNRLWHVICAHNRYGEWMIGEASGIVGRFETRRQDSRSNSVTGPLPITPIAPLSGSKSDSSMPARKIVDIDMDAKKPYVKLGQIFHFAFLSLTCASFRVLRVAATVSRTVAPTKQRIVHGSSCKSVRLATRSADLSGCETAQIFNSWDSWDNTGIREPPN